MTTSRHTPSSCTSFIGALLLLLLAAGPVRAQVATFTATDSVFEDRVELSWTIASVPDGAYFNIMRDGTQIAVAGFNQRSYADTGATLRTGTDQTDHTYCISVVSGGNTSAEVCDAGRRTFLAPTSLSASLATRETDILIRWHDNSGIEDGYRLERRLLGEQPIDQTFNLGANVTSFVDVVPRTDAGYTYTLVAFKGTTTTAPIQDNGQRAAVTPPTGVQATDGLWTDRVRVTWIDQSTTETGYKVYRGEGIEIASLPAGTTQYDDMQGIADQYCVTAVAEGGAESLRTAEGVCDPGSPGFLFTPLSVTASAGTFDDRIDVTWTYNNEAANSITGFRVFRDGASTPVGSVGPAARSYSDVSAVPGTSHSYCIMAVSDQPGDTGGPSLSSQGCTTTNGTRAHVLPPSNATATAGTLEDRVTLTWESAASTVMLFRVYRALDTDNAVPTSTTNMTLIAAPSFDQRSYDDRVINTDVVYDYCVTAVTVSAGVSASVRQQGRQAVSAYLSQQGQQVSVQPAEVLSAGAYDVLAGQGIEAAALQESTPTCAQGSRSLLPPTGVTATVDTEETHVQVSWQGASSTAQGYRIYREEGVQALDFTDAGPSATPVVTIPDDGTFAFMEGTGQSFIIEAWIRPTSDLQDGVAYPVATKGTHANYHWGLGLDGTALCFFVFSRSNCLNDAVTVEKDVWTHVALQVNTNQVRIYKNGSIFNFGLVTQMPPADSQPILIGDWQDPAASGFAAFPGQIRDIRIWNDVPTGRSLVGQENLSVRNPQPLGRWLLDDGGATAAAQGSVPNGTVTNPNWVDPGFSRVGTVSASRSSFADFGIPSGAERTYQVRAFDEYAPSLFAESKNGSYASARDTTGRRILLAPTALAATDDVFESQVVLTWEDQSRGETGYVVYRDGVLLTPSGLDPNTTTFTDTSPTRGTIHSYTVNAVDISGVSASAIDKGSAMLVSPGSVSASDTYLDQISITWVDRSENETGYKVYRDGREIDSLPADAVIYSDSASALVNNSPLEVGVSYTYCVEAIDATMVSSQTCDTGILVDGVDPPYIGLAGLVASNGTFEDRIQLRWDDAANEASYEVYRRDAAGSLQLLDELGANTTSFNDLSAEAGNAYEYCVAYYDENKVFRGGACATGWRQANGTIAGRVATLEGGGTQDIEVQLSPNPNSALLLDGISGWVQIPNAKATAFNFDAADDFTIEVWLNYTGTAGTGANEADIIEFWGTGGPGYPFVIRAGNSGNPSRTNTGQISFNRYDGVRGVGITTTRTDLNNGQWNHVAFVHDGTAKSLSVYINGTLDNTNTYTTLGNTRTTSDLFFGRRGNSFSQFFGGRMDEVRIWNTARSGPDIQATMKTRLRGDESGLVGYWPFDQTSRLVAPDITGGGANGLLWGGASWSQEAAFPVTTTTDANGNYTFTGVRYSSQTPISVTPVHPTRSFNPATKAIALSSESPIQNEVGFVDESDFTVSGRVVYEYVGTSSTDVCPVPDVEFLVQNGNEDPLLKGTSQSDGTFAVAVEPSDPNTPGDTRLVTPQKGTGAAAHSFDPPLFSYTATKDSPGLLFKDQRTQRLSGFVGGGSRTCQQSIGTVTITVRTEDGCFNQTFTYNGPENYTIDLPPQKYLVDVAVTNVPAALDSTDVQAFFAALGTQEVDLTTADATLDLIYRAPMTIAITGLPAPQNACTAGLTVREDGSPDLTLPNVPIVAENLTLNLTLLLNEDYGNNNLCPVTSGTVTVLDAIADKQEPVALTIENGQVSYETFGRSPDVFTGRIVQGVDRSYQKSISVVAEVEGRDPVTRTEWVLVEGTRERTGAFVSGTTSEIPLLVVHDPPGSNSYAYVEEGTTHCTSITNMRMRGGGAGAYGDIAIGFKASAGLGLSIENGAGFNIAGRTLGGRDNTGLAGDPSFEICTTTTETFATSDAPSAIQDDIYLGVALNLLFAKADKLTSSSCNIDRVETLAAELNPDDAFQTTYLYSNSFIETVMIPQLKELEKLQQGGSLSGDPNGNGENTSITFEDAIANWNTHLATNKKNIADGLKNAKNHSFSGGLVYEHTAEKDSTRLIKHDVSVEWGRTENDIGAIITSIGYDQKAGVTFEAYGEFTKESTEDRTTGRTVGWVFDDGDGQDFFSVDVGTDPVYGTPVFGIKSGRTSNPCEGRGQGPNGGNITQCRDNPKISVDPAVRSGVDPNTPAQFTVTITNDSESDEQREISLISLAENNLNGAIVRANGNFIGATNPQLYLIPAGQSVSVNVTVERPAGSPVYDFQDIALVAYAQDEYEIWRADMRQPFLASATALLRAQFVAPCANCRIAELEDQWTFRKGDAPMQLTIDDYSLGGEQVDGDLSRLTLGAEYRLAGEETWHPIVRRSGADLQAEGAASFTTSWLPEADGIYEVRAFSECATSDSEEIGRVASRASLGTVDTSPPTVFAPEPRDGSLGFGDEAYVVFDEALACAQVTEAQIQRLDAGGAVLETLENILVQCDDRRVTVRPEGGWQQAEDGGRYLVRLPAGGLTAPADSLGNRVEEDVTWQFVVQKADFAFNPLRVGAAATFGLERTLEVSLANTKPEPVGFTIDEPLALTHFDDTGLPTGTQIKVEPSVQTGTIEAESRYPVQFRLPPSLEQGTWRGQVAARGEHGAASLGSVYLSAEVEVGCPAPTWTLSAAAQALPLEMVITAELEVDGTVVTDPAVQLAARVDGELRGVGRPNADGLIRLRVRGAADGEQVTFEAWQPSVCSAAGVRQQTRFAGAASVHLGRLTLGRLEDEPTELPRAFALSQNYPNPFNPATTIAYALPEAAQVELVVYDVLGRQVMTLVRAEQQAGQYEVVFDASHLASGLYLYRIQAGTHKAVKKMMLVK
ncbi:MAG: LamG-like jellyroll fold domain-containing protein [Bacteroidota bacterium]